MNILKKAVVLLIGAALAISLASCDKEDKETDVSGSDFVSASNQRAVSSEETTESVQETAKPAERDNSYTIEDAVYANDDGSIKFTYPQIKGLYDADMQHFYNDFFKADCKKEISEDGLAEFTGNYEVTCKTADTLSIVFRCNGYMEGGMHPNSYAYAYTIDLQTGETVIPSRMIDIGKLVTKFIAGEWTPVDGVGSMDEIREEVALFYAMLDADSMKDLLAENDVITVTRNDKGEYVTSGTQHCVSYLDQEGEPVLILIVSHVAGDYAEIKLNDVKVSE